MHGRSGLPKDDKAAFKHYLKGCELGAASSGGYQKLGNMYANGKGVAVDMDAAARWMRKAVASAKTVADAQWERKARDWLTERGLEVDA